MLTEPEREELRTMLEQIDPTDFEHFVARCFEADGWTATVTRQSGDQAIDVILEQTEPIAQRVPVQVKHRNDTDNRFGSTETREYQALDEQDPSYTSTMLVANTTFTPAAKSVAHDRQQFSLFDVDDLVDLIARHGLDDDLREAARGEVDSRRKSTPGPDGERGKSVSVGSKWVPSGRLDRKAAVVAALYLLQLTSFGLLMTTQSDTSLLAAASTGGVMITWFALPTAIYTDVRASGKPSGVAAVWFIGTLLFFIFGSTVYAFQRFT